MLTKDQGGVLVFIVFLHEVAVVLVGLSLKLVVELDGGAASRSKEIQKGRRAKDWGRRAGSIRRALLGL